MAAKLSSSSLNKSARKASLGKYEAALVSSTKGRKHRRLCSLSTKAAFSSMTSLQVIFPIRPQETEELWPYPSVAQMTACPRQINNCFRASSTDDLERGKDNTRYFFFLLGRNRQKRGGKGGRGQVSAPLYTGSQAAPREETLHWGLLLDPRRKTPRKAPCLTR